MAKVKICGLTNVEDALMACDAGADFLGFVLCNSARWVDYDTLGEIVSAVDGRAAMVGVFSQESDLRRFAGLSKVNLDYYQIYFGAPENSRPQPRVGWIEAKWIDHNTHSLVANNGLLLADFKNTAPEDMERLLGGLNGSSRERLIIAGNLTAATAAEVVRRYRPFAVDVARGTEARPGVKDERLVREFIEGVRNVS